MSGGIPGQYPGHPTFPDDSHEDPHSHELPYDIQSDGHAGQDQQHGEIAQDQPHLQDQYYEPAPAGMRGLAQHIEPHHQYAEAPNHDSNPNENHQYVQAQPHTDMPLYEARHDPYEGYQHLRPPPQELPPDENGVGFQQQRPRGHHTARGARHEISQPTFPQAHEEKRRSHGGRYDKRRGNRHDDYDEEDDYDPPVRRKERVSRRSFRGGDPSGGPQVQVYAANQPPPAAAPAAPAVNLGETMQMMMMSQMMQQQMQAQQMQVAQMQAMMGKKSDGGGCDRGSECGRRKGSTSVNIQSAGRPRGKLVKGKAAQPAVKKIVMPVVAPVVKPTLAPPIDEDGATFENWQEATIILCLMIVGLIYLVSSRASAPPPDDKKTARHLTGASS